MAKEFKFPDVGEGIAEGEILKWFVKEGDEVKEHQALGEVETDKAVVEMPSPYSGTVLKILPKEGDTVQVGDTMVIIGEKGEQVRMETKHEVREERKPEIKPAGVVGYLEEAPEAKAVQGEILATPAVRKLAKDLGVDINQVKGTGPNGRITEEDIKNTTGGKTEGPEFKVMKKYDMWGYIDRTPLKGVRKVVAEHMVKSVRTIPHVTHFDDANVTKLFELRNREKGDAEMKGIKLTFLPYVVKAVVEALKQHPALNASLEDESQTIIIKKYYNIGIAVDTESGLMVPVIKGADNKSIFDIAKESNELAEKCRNRTVDLMDLRGGSFTITNIGSLGGIHATPIINHPEVAILMTGKMYDVLALDVDKLKVKKIMPLSLSFDHRVIDGADAARFVNTLKQYLENPEMLSDGKT